MFANCCQVRVKSSANLGLYLLPLRKGLWCAQSVSAAEKSDKKLIEPSDLGLACLSATAPSVFVKIRSPNDPPHRLGHPHGQKNLLRSPRLTFFRRLPNFDQNIKFIHSLGSGLLFWVGTHKQQLLMLASGGNRALTTKSGTRQGEQQQQ